MVNNKCKELLRDAFLIKNLLPYFCPFPFTFFLCLYRVYASSHPAFAAERLTAFTGTHTGTETALAQFLDLTLTMIFQNISPIF
jgi:hypothetical protein